MPGFVVGTWGVSVNKTDENPCLHGGDILVGGGRRQTINNRYENQVIVWHIRR